jgi:hypothetical protein
VEDILAPLLLKLEVLEVALEVVEPLVLEHQVKAMLVA